MFDGEVDLSTRVHFGFWDWIDFPGYTKEELEKEINKKIKKGK
jgi:hypothetical protein